jgi:hypothetical protein
MLTSSLEQSGIASNMVNIRSTQSETQYSAVSVTVVVSGHTPTSAAELSISWRAVSSSVVHSAACTVDVAVTASSSSEREVFISEWGGSVELMCLG